MNAGQRRVASPLTHLRDADAARRSAPSSGLDSACDVSGPDRPHMWTRSDPRGSSEGPLRAGKMLRKLLLFAAAALLSGARATFRLSPGDPQLVAAQSYAQSRNNARPPIRTLNPAIHRSDYTYRGGYHYRYQPPGISPPVVYPPFPLSPPVIYHRPPVPALPYHHAFKGPVAPPVVYQPRQRFKGHLPYNLRGPCRTNPAPTLPSAPVVPLPALPPAPQPALPATPAAQLAIVTPEVAATAAAAAAAPVETSAPVTLPVSTQSGFTTTASAVETGVDPCAMGHDCEHVCVNSNASYYCKCRNGYILNADKKTCSLKQVKVEVVEDPCKCEARLAFQKQTQATIQQLTAKIADVSKRIERLESTVGRG
ncbi:matrilin-3a isoform X1 [Takifugu flavidus]|uniref:matrilin-3a isoform X1 n=1 Tax=Takifugu flavidus TaxID=433684 RepID=UPI00254473F2|nr:matrilin-3a isoform X1 [Takifugu flavidus]